MNNQNLFKTANEFYYDTKKVSWGFIYNQFKIRLTLNPNNLYLNSQFQKFKDTYIMGLNRRYEKKQFQTIGELEDWLELVQHEVFYEDHSIIENKEKLIVHVGSYFDPAEIELDGSNEFLYIFLLQLSLLDEAQAISFMAYQLISRYREVGNFRTALKKGLQKYNSILSFDSHHKKLIELYIGTTSNGVNTSVPPQQRTETFTNSHWVLIFYYWIKSYINSEPRHLGELTSLARFIHLISGKSPIKVTNSSDIYQKLQKSPNFKNDQYLIPDLSYTKDLFQKYGMNEAAQLIENEINIAKQEKLNKD